MVMDARESKAVEETGLLEEELLQRKRAEEALENAGREKEVILDSLVEHVIYEDTTMKILWPNRAACESAGLAREELIGRHCYEIWPRRDEPCPDCPVTKAIETGQPQDIEKSTPDGRTWFIRGYPVRDANGDIVGAIELTLEITGRKQAEEALQESEERLSAFMDSAPDAFALFDSELNLVEINGIGLGMLPAGTKKEDAIGKNVAELYPNMRETGRYDKYLEVVQTGKSFFIDDIVPHPKFGDRHLAVRAFKVGDGLGIVVADITEHKRREEALQRLKEFNEGIVQGVAEAILIEDPSGIITFVNPALETLLGYTSDELVGRHWRTIVPQEEIELVQAQTSLRPQGTTDRYETRLLAKDGHKMPVIVSARPLFEDGTFSGVLSAFSDITEQKQAEEALRESEEKYRNLVEGSTDGIAIVEGLEIKFVNPALLKMFGCQSEDEMVGHKFTDFVSPGYRNLMAERGRAREEGKHAPTHYGFKALRKDRTEFEAEISVDRILYEGRVARQGIVRDITERKRAEEALKESEEKFRTLAERSPNMIFINKKGRVVYANQKCEEITGYKREEFYSPDFDFLTLIAPGYIDLVKANFIRHMKGEELPPYEYALVTKEGKRIEAIYTTRLIRYEAESAILGIITDITERKRAEKEIYRRSEELAALNAIAMAVTSTLDLQEVLQAIQERVMKLLGEKYPPIFALFDEGDQTFEIVLTHVQEQPLTRAEKLLGMKFEELALSLSTLNPAVRETLLAGKPYVTDDGSDLLGPQASRRLVRAAQRTLGVKCIVDLPLWAKGKLVGTMILFSRKEKMSDQEMELLSSIASQAAVAIENARAYQKLDEHNLQTISALVSAVEARDPYTSGHSQEVTEYAVAIAEKLGLPKDEIESLRWAGLLHDIGKIGVSDAVLSKPSRLTAAEYIMIKAHPLISAEIVGKMQGLAHLIPIIRHHHERYDGNGYPDGLEGEEIPLLARILAVADGFEAMTAERPYRFAKSQEEAREALKAGAGSQWDPQVVEAFVKMHK